MELETKTTCSTLLFHSQEEGEGELVGSNTLTFPVLFLLALFPGFLIQTEQMLMVGPEQGGGGGASLIYSNMALSAD